MTALDLGKASAPGLSPGLLAALAALLTGALCLVLQPYAPWLFAFPAAWTVPATSRALVGAATPIPTLPPAQFAFPPSKSHAAMSEAKSSASMAPSATDSALAALNA